MAKSKQNELIKFDSRMTEFNLSRGILTKEELEKHLSQLPDLASEALPLTLEDNESPNETH